jgi:hypothetical protein
MGSWGSGAFENDSALDWVAAGVTLERIQHAFDCVRDCNVVVDADTTQDALVAAECIAGAMGYPVVGMTEDALKQINALTPFDPELIEQAKYSVSKIISYSELNTLFENNDLEKYKVALSDLMGRLNADLALAKQAEPVTGQHDFECAFCDDPIPPAQCISLNINHNNDDENGLQAILFAHLSCLNGKLKTSHFLQHWEVDTSEVDRMEKELKDLMRSKGMIKE